MRAGSAWVGRRVMVTGHTGFKGGWLTMWLGAAGAEIHGYALDPPTSPSLYEVAHLATMLRTDARGDLADAEAVAAAMRDAHPEVVFHLAAQPIVRQGYADPIGTIRTNTLGTAHVLDAIRKTPGVRAAVIVSTDKVYAERQDGRPHAEADSLGGPDPYSASKAAAELLVECYQRSYFDGVNEGSPRLATARAGNVIGGGDWADGRLVPDCVRAFGTGTPVKLRYPQAVRPWQHVLEPVSGYVLLAERLLTHDGPAFRRAWNFAPAVGDDVSTKALAEMVARHWGPSAEVDADEASPWHEAGVLRLDASHAANVLGWHPYWTLERAVETTVAWHRAHAAGADMQATSLNQISDYQGS